jgi:uncharacterized membrane protein
MPIGPVQLLVVSFDQPNFTGEIVAELQRLRASETARLIDALVVHKSEDGELTAVQWSDLSLEEAQGMGALVGALIGVGMDGEAGMEAGARAGQEAAADGHLIDEDQAWDIGDSLPNGSAAAVALIEHLWAAPLRDAIARAGGVPVSDNWIHPLDLVEIGLMKAAELEPA